MKSGGKVVQELRKKFLKNLWGSKQFIIDHAEIEIS